MVSSFSDFTKKYQGSISQAILRQINGKSGELADEKKKKIELAYFMLTHEANRLVTPYDHLQDIKKFIMNQIEDSIEKGDDFQGLVHFSNEPKRRAQQIEDITEDFVEIFTRINHTSSRPVKK